MGLEARVGDPATGRESSGVEVAGQGLVEVEVRDGLGLYRIEGGRLIEEPVRRSLSGGPRLGGDGGDRRAGGTGIFPDVVYRVGRPGGAGDPSRLASGFLTSTR
jgi:hypothetical protein